MHHDGRIAGDVRGLEDGITKRWSSSRIVEHGHDVETWFVSSAAYATLMETDLLVPFEMVWVQNRKKKKFITSENQA